MRDAFICDGIRTPIGRYGGALAGVRADDLAAIPLRELLSRNPGLDPAAIDDVISAALTRPVKITATWRIWRRYWPVIRIPCRAPRLTACVARVWMRSVLPPGRSKPARPIC